MKLEASVWLESRNRMLTTLVQLSEMLRHSLIPAIRRIKAMGFKAETRRAADIPQRDPKRPLLKEQEKEIENKGHGQMHEVGDTAVISCSHSAKHLILWISDPLDRNGVCNWSNPNSVV